MIKFLNLLRLAKCVFVLPHGNADPERGFSINKRIIDIHGGSLGPETIEAIRLVKDYLLTIGGVEKVAINKELLKVLCKCLLEVQVQFAGKKERRK